MQKFIAVGRLCKDPEVRYVNDKAVANFSIAVDRKYKRDEEPKADFFDCTAFGKLGEFAEKYLSKGTKIILVGRFENNNYTNKEGQKVYAFKLIADEIEFAESKKAASENAGGETAKSNDNSFMNVPEGADDELPFN